MGNSTAKDGRRDRLAPLLLLLVFIVLGAWARLVNAGSSASLWFDEAWRIQHLLDAESLFQQMVSAPNHIDPPLFNLIIYLLAQVHNTELVLRLASIIPGVLAILMAWLVGRQLFAGRWLPLFSAFLVAFSPWMTIFSKELKPYALGVLVHMTVLYGILRYSRTPTARATATFTGLLILALFFSPNIVFAYPGICIAMLAMALRTGTRRRIVEALAAGTALLAGSALYYIAFLHGSVYEQSFNPRTSLWFCPHETVAAAVGWFFRRYLGFYSKMAFTDYSLFEGVGAFLEILYPLMALAGAALVLFWSRRRFLQLFCLFLMPILAMVPFNILKLWPFGPLRMNLFLMVYIIFPPLILLDQIQRSRSRFSRYVPVGLAAALLMALQFPIHFGDYSSSRVTMRRSAEAVINIIEFNPADPPIPLLINRLGEPSFTYYSRHHQKVSNRFGACAGVFEPRVLASRDSPLYTTGELLRECQKNRQVAIYVSQYNEHDRLLFKNDFSIDHHSFDARNVHSCILHSEIAGYEESLRPLFSSKRFTGDSKEWKVIYRSPPLPLTDPQPGALVIVNFDLTFKSRGTSIQFRFIDQDGSPKPFAPSIIQNTTPGLPRRIESAVYTKIKQRPGTVSLEIAASGSYNFLLKNVNCFMTRTETPKPAIGPGTCQLRAGDRTRVLGALTSLDGFWPDDKHTFGWTTGDTLIRFDDLAVSPEDTVLMLKTFGWMPPGWRNEMNRNGLRVYLNGDRRARFLGPGGDPVRYYYFEIPSGIHTIRTLRIISNTFSPRKLGISDDARDLGIDLKSVQFPAMAQTAPVPRNVSTAGGENTPS